MPAEKYESLGLDSGALELPKECLIKIDREQLSLQFLETESRMVFA
jgi:hypothetical protein